MTYKFPILTSVICSLLATSAMAFYQQLAVPSYFYPCAGESCYWSQVNNSSPKVSIAIINPANGVGQTFNPDYLSQVIQTQAANISVLGYVWTNYAQRDIDQVEDEIEMYFNWYNVDGIFFDGGANSCTAIPYYRTLNVLVKSKCRKGITAINYGTDTPECMTSVSDILVNFEGTYSSYVAWTPASWYGKYPSKRFWHIVHDTPQANLANAMQLSLKRNAGWVYVTNMSYSILPTIPYWNLELSYV